MKGTVSNEVAVPAAAGDVWAIYSTIRLAQLAVGLIPHLIQKFELVEGDGGEGTVLSVTLPPSGGSTESITFKEKFVRIDNEKLIKVNESVEGGYLDLGFRLYRVTFEIIKGSVDSCVIRSSIDYDIAEGFEQNVALVTTDTLAALAKAVGNYLTQKEPVQIKDVPK